MIPSSFFVKIYFLGGEIVGTISVTKIGVLISKVQ